VPTFEREESLLFIFFFSERPSLRRSFKLRSEKKGSHTMGNQKSETKTPKESKKTQEKGEKNVTREET